MKFYKATRPDGASNPGRPEAGGMTTPSRTITDAEALDQIAAFLGLYTTDPGNNPVDELIADIVGSVQQTGRATDTPEGA